MKYKVIAVNADQDFCSCCGKSDLSRVVWLEHIESGEISHYGTVCAQKLASFDSIKKAANTFSNVVKNELRSQLQEVEIKHWNKKGNDFKLAVAAEFLPNEARIREIDPTGLLVVNYLNFYHRHKAA